ncbi:hypothetical protein [Vibrio anguillarum]|uniref:Uncharacterized protein n=1 Tax=Vibrio anguillarum TaxID=55601 RepID=A0A7U6FS00_VIBAN|nr:hypothetical protein [Vibrio anguillarum]AZS26247.1 hypothetical protein DYL72_15170 [Vibrio anguillarum]MBF4374528.1 hypothetical protein [Vibrio anguillarum]
MNRTRQFGQQSLEQFVQILNNMKDECLMPLVVDYVLAAQSDSGGEMNEKVASFYVGLLLQAGARFDKASAIQKIMNH